MTTTMLNEFVEKILVHERDQKGRQLSLLDGADESGPVILGIVGNGVEGIGDKGQDYFFRYAGKFPPSTLPGMARA